MKDCEQYHEKRNIRNLKHPKEDFVFRYDSAVCFVFIGAAGSFEPFDCAHDATDQDHEGSGVEDVEDYPELGWEFLVLSASVFESCHKREEKRFDKTLQYQSTFQTIQSSLNLLRCSSSAGTIGSAVGCKRFDDDAQYHECAEDATGMDRCVVRQISHQTTQDEVFSRRVEWWTHYYEDELCDEDVDAAGVVD